MEAYNTSSGGCHEKTQMDLVPCEVDVMVWRGTTWKTVPQQPLTVRCPVKHCGESLNVTWCKQLDENNCKPISYTENVEIRQTDERTQDELISYLTFTRISIGDNGLYKCTLKGHKYQLISHIINISVSGRQVLLPQCQNIDSFKRLNLGTNCRYFLLFYRFKPRDELPSAAGDKEVPWLSYSFLYVGVALLVITLTAAAILSCYGCKRQLNPTQGQEVGQYCRKPSITTSPDDRREQACCGKLSRGEVRCPAVW
ncbi:B- and T-lymphocyte attenuator isoform X4 [Cyclopterus lumpus]|uniref:B- and T-lymphocyte attenuator isoform X4 n=1 Tax=Cyclopterus lumpus TaxID=8103 RepID=UPI0014861646|nr:B- and T-lymphocyte attenuator isoform X4 [Cyclopterus lumpus]